MPSTGSHTTARTQENSTYHCPDTGKQHIPLPGHRKIAHTTSRTQDNSTYHCPDTGKQSTYHCPDTGKQHIPLPGHRKTAHTTARTQENRAHATARTQENRAHATARTQENRAHWCEWRVLLLRLLKPCRGQVTRIFCKGRIKYEPPMTDNRINEEWISVNRQQDKWIINLCWQTTG